MTYSSIARDTLRAWFDRMLPARVRFRHALTAHYAARLAGHFSAMPADAPCRPNTEPLRIHFWTPHSWSSTAIHVDRVLPHLRAQAAALQLPWRITSGSDLPPEPMDWLLCLKAVPPRRGNSSERTVLLLNDDADRIWSRLRRFDHVVVVSSPVLASLVGTAHPHVWFIEESESVDTIVQGERALGRVPPSARAPILLWHGSRESLDGLIPLCGELEAFSRETGAELSIVTNRKEATEQWGDLRVHYIAWSPELLASVAAQARLAIVPARPTLADSYLKSAGRLRRMFALGCPAIGDARSPDVVAFSEATRMPSANTGAEWLSAMRHVWHAPARLDDAARRGHALVREQYSVVRTATQWLWFFDTAGEKSRERYAPRTRAR
jgi:hypothetical protein